MKGPPTRRAGGPITGNPGGPITLAKSAHTGPILLADDMRVQADFDEPLPPGEVDAWESLDADFQDQIGEAEN